MVANVGIAVEIGSQAQPVQFLFPFPVFVDAIIDFRVVDQRLANVGATSGSVVAYPSRAWPKIWG